MCSITTQMLNFCVKFEAPRPYFGGYFEKTMQTLNFCVVFALPPCAGTRGAEKRSVRGGRVLHPLKSQCNGELTDNKGCIEPCNQKEQLLHTKLLTTPFRLPPSAK